MASTEHKEDSRESVRNDEIDLGSSPVGACRYITAEKSLEEARKHRGLAERASQAKSEFIAQVSHELCTPMNSILGFAQLMGMDLDQPLSGKQQERLQVLQRSARRLLSLVDQLLQVGKIEQGRLSLQLRPVNVYTIVRRCAEAMTPMTDERGISIEIDVAGSSTSAVRADANALEQVLINLLSNGIKYNHQGGQLTVKYRTEDAGKITVEDTGDGLTASQIAHLFEPFNRLDTAQRGIQGTGLGLAISRKLVEAMRGTLQVRRRCRIVISGHTAARAPCPRRRRRGASTRHAVPVVRRPDISRPLH